MQDETWVAGSSGPRRFRAIVVVLPDVCHLAEGWIRRMCEVRRIQVTS